MHLKVGGVCRCMGNFRYDRWYVEATSRLGAIQFRMNICKSSQHTHNSHDHNATGSEVTAPQAERSLKISAFRLSNLPEPANDQHR
jgi:hypothetical protein